MSSIYKDKIDQDRADQLKLSRPYVPGNYIPGTFWVTQRDTYHFDIGAPRRDGYVQWYYQEENPNGIAYPMNDGEMERAFRIRGEPGCIYIVDERWDKERPHPRMRLEFPSVESAMAWIVATLMIPVKK